MGKQRRRHSAAFKAKVALEAAKEVKTLNELAAEHGVHQMQISKWKRELLETIPSIFTKAKTDTRWETERDDLYRQIGEITVERDWLKKKFQSLT